MTGFYDHKVENAPSILPDLRTYRTNYGNVLVLRGSNFLCSALVGKRDVWGNSSARVPQEFAYDLTPFEAVLFVICGLQLRGSGGAEIVQYDKETTNEAT